MFSNWNRFVLGGVIIIFAKNSGYLKMYIIILKCF